MSQIEASENETVDLTSSEPVEEKRELAPAAKRALAEAEARRAERDREKQDTPAEIGGSDGPDPTRYGDWEKDGIVSDF